MAQMARNRSALHDLHVLAQGASNRVITVFRVDIIPPHDMTQVVEILSHVR